MRVLHVLHHSLPWVSGYAVRSDAILRGQREDGLSPLGVTSARHAAPAAAAEWVEGTLFLRVPAYGDGAPPLWREWVLMRRLERRVLEALRAFRPHLVHAHSPVLCGWPALRAARRCGVPFAYEVRDLWENASVDRGKFAEASAFYRLARAAETALLRRADGVTPICAALRAEVVRRRGREDGVLVCPNGVDPERFLPGEPDPAARRRWSPAGGPLLAYLGAFQPYEGLAILVCAFARLAAELPTARLLIAGEGSEAARVHAAVRELNLVGRVHLPGLLPPAEVAEALRAADLLVYPRLRTRTTELTTPLKPLEALAAARPVVASDLPALRELVRPGETGELVPPGDAAALAEACLALLRDPARRRRLGEAGRRFALRERRWPEITRRYAPFYRALLARRPLRRGYCPDRLSAAAAPRPARKL